MGETEDPRKALQDKSVAVRAAAARDLARVGTFEDLPPLIEIAVEQKSSALRLYAAAAAADILHRYRGLRGGPTLTAAQRKQVHQWARSFDPGRNPGLISLLSALQDDEARKRLARLLRDPRNGVRAGALVAVRRMALSAAAFDDDAIVRTVTECLADSRMPPDVTLDLVKLVGEAGYLGLRDAVRRIGPTGRLHGEAATEAMKRLDARLKPEGWDGLWVLDTLDVFEVGDSEDDAPWRLVGDGAVSTGGAPVPLAIDSETGRATLKDDKVPLRLLWVARLGQDEPRRAMQQGETTWWEQEGKALSGGLERVVTEATSKAAPALRPHAARLAEDESATAPRIRGMLLWRIGDLDEALALLEELTKAKKPRADLFYWLGRVQADRGEAKAAGKALDTYLAEAPKKGGYRAEAEALKAELG